MPTVCIGTSTACSFTAMASTRFTSSESGSRDPERPFGAFGPFGRAWHGRFDAGLMRRLKKASQSFHLTIASVEAVDDLKQDFVLVHQVIHQGLQLLLRFHVQLVVVLGAKAVAVRLPIERHQDQ